MNVEVSILKFEPGPQFRDVGRLISFFFLDSAQIRSTKFSETSNVRSLASSVPNGCLSQRQIVFLTKRRQRPVTSRVLVLELQSGVAIRVFFLRVS